MHGLKAVGMFCHCVGIFYWVILFLKVELQDTYMCIEGLFSL